MPDILLIEKDVEERNRLAAALQGAGHDVVAVASTVDALLAVSERAFDIVVLNEEIFADAGVSTLRAAHAKDADAQAIVVLNTGSCFGEPLEYGPIKYDFFCKHSNPKLLLHSVSRAMEFKQALREQRLAEGANRSLRRHLDEQVGLALDLEQELQQLKRITQNVGVPMALISPDRAVRWSNAAYDELLATRDAVTCLHAACLGGRCSTCVVNEILSGRSAYSRTEVQCRLPVQSGNWFEIIDTPLLSPNGEVLGVVEVALPIDERKKSQFALEEAKSGLEQSVAERTLSLKASYERLEREVEVRKLTEKRMLAELELNAAVASLANSLVSGTESLDEVAASALEYALSFTKSSMGFVTKIDFDTEQNHVLAHRGLPAECLRRLPPAVAEEATPPLFLHKNFGERPFFTNDSADPRLKNIGDGQQRIHNCINAPVIVEGKLGGMIVTANSEQDYTYDALGAVLRMSSLFALAIQRWNKEHELIRAKSSAEEANKAKTQFLANMSHELRTPLNGIMGSARVLLELGPEHEQREFLDLIMKSSGQLLMLINDLLVLSHLELKRFSPASTQFGLHEVLESTLALYREQAAQKGLDFSLSVAPDMPPFISADPNCFKLVLSNLIINAIQFTRTGSVKITVRLAGKPVFDQDTSAYQAQVLVTVSDTGQGVPAKMQEEIFKQFTLVEDCMTKQYGGAGLGLSICRQLVTLMGGKIWVESELGKGSTFSFTFDVWLESAPENREERTGEKDSPLSATMLDILYAEDEFTNQELVKRFFEKRGHRVCIANDGLEVMDRLREHPGFDVVLMDLKMPRVDGIEATRKIRSGECPNVDPNIPIIAVTAFAGEGEEAKGREVGLDAYLTKPVDMVDLLENMHRVVGLHRREA